MMQRNTTGKYVKEYKVKGIKYRWACLFDFPQSQRIGSNKNKFSRIAATASLVVAMVCAETALSAEPVFADAEIIDFESVSYTYTPSPFKVRQAKKLGIPVETKTEPGVSLSGYLARPAGEEARAAIVLLHSCAGITEHVEMWSARLVSWGYVVLSVDSFKPRGFDYICDGRAGASTTPWRRALDAYGAKRFLSTRSFVDPARIAVMGMSHGGMTVLEIIKQSTSGGLSMEPFQAAVAFYPLCSEPERIDTPTLILSGSEDSWTPAELCAQYADSLQPLHDIRLEVFAGAHHLFDHPGIDTIDAGYVIRSNPQAAARASEIVREFLLEHL
jgi:dienelactone hydrolase